MEIHQNAAEANKVKDKLLSYFMHGLDLSGLLNVHLHVTIFIFYFKRRRTLAFVRKSCIIKFSTCSK